MFIPNEIYKTILEYVAIPTVDIIFLNKDKHILLGMRKNEPLQGVYYLPGGRIHKGETLIEAAIRKSKEELNIHIEHNKLQFVGTYDDIFDNSVFQGISTHCIPSTFIYELNNIEQSNIKFDDQHDDMKFFSYKDISLHPFLQKRLNVIQSEYHIF